MAYQEFPAAEPGEVYQIHIQGMLGKEWTEWFDGMQISIDGQGNTLISGRVADQAALHGLLDQVRDLGLPLLSVSKLNR